MKLTRLCLSLCIAVSASLTSGFKISPETGEQSNSAYKSIKAPISPTLFTGSPRTVSSVYSHYQFRPNVIDTVDEPLLFSIQNKPDWLRFDSSTGMLEGTPMLENLGSFKNILISASNLKHSVSLPAFKITVTSAVDIAHQYGVATQGTDSKYPFYSPAIHVLDKDDGTYNRTRGGGNSENWLQVKLPKLTHVYKVVIKAKREFASNLKNADVYLSNKPFLGKLVKSDLIATLKGLDGEQIINLKKGRVGSYLIIKGKNDSANTKQLALIALEVYGETPKKPAFKKHIKNYLLDKSVSVGTPFSKVRAIDYQKDKLSYTIKEDVPFIINTNGEIKVNGVLSKSAYHFTVGVSDGVNQVSTNISVKISTRKNLQQALQTGDHSLVTDGQLYQEINKIYQRELKQCFTKLESTIASNSREDALKNCQKSHPATAIVRTVEHLENNYLNFDYEANGACSTSLGKATCHDDLLINSRGESLGAAFMQGAKQLKKQLSIFDESGESVFRKNNTDLLIKLFVLLGDKYRQTIHYPMNKTHADSLPFYKALFADYAVHYARPDNLYQPDLGDYTSNPATLNAKQGLTKTVTLKPTQYDEWTSSLLYAAPGKPIKIIRTDDTDNEVWMRVSMLRGGSSRIWNPLQYTRPRFIRSHAIKLEAGREYNYSTPYGGPIMIWSKGKKNKAKSFSVRLKGIVKNPSLSKFDESSLTQFIDELDTTDFDWVDIKTDFVELHILKNRMKEAFNHTGSFPYNGNASLYLAELKQYLIINNLNLAGFKGRDLTLNKNIKNWCIGNSLACESHIHSKPRMQHIISDVRAHCGSGCSGNPYDAAWAILPTAWGDNHEFGHNLQSNRLKIYANKSLEVSNNIFPLLSNWQYINDHKIVVHPGLVRPDSQHAFKMIYDVFKNGEIIGENHPLWRENGVYDQAGERLAFYQQLIFVHQTWDIYTKLYLLDRLLTDALKSDEKWQDNKSKLGFSNYTVEDAKTLRGNDFMAIALSNISQQDHRNYFSMWGIKVSEKSQQQIISNGFSSSVPRVFYPVNGNALTAALPAKKVVLDGPEIHTLSLRNNCHQELGCDKSRVAEAAKLTVNKQENDSIYFVSKYADNGVTQPTNMNDEAYSTYSMIKVKAANTAGKQFIINYRAAKSFSKRAVEGALANDTLNHVTMNNSVREKSQKVTLIIWRSPEDNKHLVTGETYKVIETPILKIMKNSTYVGQIMVSISDFRVLQ